MPSQAQIDVYLFPCAPGDLGAIDARYDVAASTACGALDYIVVDTTATASRCVELLRERQLGVATFLILEKQEHLAAAAKEKPAAPEGRQTARWGVQMPTASQPLK
jgi:chromosome segregation ATPase